MQVNYFPSTLSWINNQVSKRKLSLSIFFFFFISLIIKLSSSDFLSSGYNWLFLTDFFWVFFLVKDFIQTHLLTPKVKKRKTVAVKNQVADWCLSLGKKNRKNINDWMNVRLKVKKLINILSIECDFMVDFILIILRP